MAFSCAPGDSFSPTNSTKLFLKDSDLQPRRGTSRHDISLVPFLLSYTRNLVLTVAFRMS